MRCAMVETPYNTPTHSRQECIRYALWCCASVDASGEAAFASHLFYTQFIAENKAGRARGISYRDELARRLMDRIIRFTDLGLTPGMFRDIDSTGLVEERKLDGEFREKWLAGLWPPCSARLTVIG